MKHTGFSALGRRTAAPPIAWLMKMTLDHPNLISLAAGFTDNETLPVKETRALFDRILGSARTGQSALQYGTTAGEAELRTRTVRRLQAQDGSAPGAGPATEYSPERLLVTNGSQQMLYILTEALCDPGDLVLLEDPTYFVYLGIAQSHGLRCRGIRMTPEGLDVAHLEQVLTRLQQEGDLSRVKLLYLVSYHQNPTGITTSLERKRAALDVLRHFERAAGHPIYLLEDAAYRELQAGNDPVPVSALTLKGGAERVLYTSTFSKPFATGARVGFGLLPEAVFKIAVRIKANHDFGTASLLQQLLLAALRSGTYDRHLAVLRKRYACKADVMLGALRKHFPPPVRWIEPGGGLYVWTQLPPRLKTGVTSRVFQAALAHEVLYVPGELCYADDPTRRKPTHEMRLSFGGAPLAEIRQGIARLGAVLAELC
jgi:2-aminoadipate transaminase